MKRDEAGPRPPRSLAAWIDALPAQGRHTFTSAEADGAAGGSPNARRAVLARLVQKHRLISPRRGFYVIVPSEYRRTAAVPPTWYLDAMMRHLEQPYYVGLLSAAALHGAAHQQPQRLQVVTFPRVRPTGAEANRIAWVTKQTVHETPVEQRNVVTGYLTVSTPEATACDLVQYVGQAGGLANAATVLTALAPRLEAERLRAAADAAAGVAVIQRLGFLLDHVVPTAVPAATAALEAWLHQRPHWPAPLRHDRPTRGAPLAARWNVLVNEQVHPDVAAARAEAIGGATESAATRRSWDEWLEEAEWGDDADERTAGDGPTGRAGAKGT